MSLGDDKSLWLVPLGSGTVTLDEFTRELDETMARSVLKRADYRAAMKFQFRRKQATVGG
jgi:hypothetical protein